MADALFTQASQVELGLRGLGWRTGGARRIGPDEKAIAVGHVIDKL